MGWHICMANTALCSHCLGVWGFVCQLTVVPCAEPFLWLEYGIHSPHLRGEELALPCSILLSDVWCTADVPLKRPGKHSHTGALHLAAGTEVQFKISTQANTPASKDQVFLQCFTPCCSSRSLYVQMPPEQGTSGFLALSSLYFPCSFKHFRTCSRRGLEEVALKALARPLAQEGRGQGCLGQECLQPFTASRFCGR